jgi:pyruvate,orthophosphate dikinase
VKSSPDRRSSCAIAVHRIPFEGPSVHLPAKEIVGSKAHCLMRMAGRGLAVPPAFVISTETCRDYVAHGAAALDGLDGLLKRELAHLATVAGRGFGDARRPLLVSVRSGAAVSMPGMMETVLNVGLGSATLRALVRATGNPRLAQDCRRRLVQQYGEVVHGIAPARFEERLKAVLSERGATEIGELDTAELERLAKVFEDEFEIQTGQAFPEDPLVQLRSAIEAVLRSWSSDRATTYRQLYSIPDDLGTAVTVQAMVFGNLGPTSGSGVGFTRDPANGNNELYVDFLPNVQGEDIVAGRHRASGLDELARRAPTAHRALIEAKDVLEREFHDMQDFEFTVERGRLQLLQTRAGKRTPLAALRIAHDMVAKKIISPSEGLATLAGFELDNIEETGLQTCAGLTSIATGTPASVGVAVGAAAFDPDRALQMGRSGKAVILLRRTAETEDIEALAKVAGLVTAEGARTSHAAVVARQLGKPCIVACSGLSIDPSGRRATVGSERAAEGDLISIDASSGLVFKGELEIVRTKPTELIAEIRSWREAAPAVNRGNRRKGSAD